jgi:putative phosphoesterase
MRVGVVADTHGLLRPEVPVLLAGCDAILHAGDVGDPAVLDGLARVAPVTAVRGNLDGGSLGALPTQVAGVLDEVRFRMVHRREDVDPAWPADCDLVVFGHSHRPELAWQGSCLLLNPGSCGQPRFRLPLTLAVLAIAGRRIVPELRAVP